jgi:cellulose synthase/poly-beta-1,6-N-acetylglucosamine synthase-like glycosyltransferase
MTEAVFWLSVGIVSYVYAGYPALLWIVSRFVRRARPSAPTIWPRVTLVISAYNEEGSIRQKIVNTLEVDYPRDRLEVLVISDASEDRTDAIVREFEEQGIGLVRMPERGGKTVGLNRAVEVATGEILVFSDANAMYRRDALKALITGFSEPRVGAVIGESTYASGDTDSERSEGLYWRYETWLKDMESRIGSVVGGDGAIYAVRRDLYTPMRADALSDFVNPLQVVRKGFRCVYERSAQSVEKAAEDFGKEFRRKVRIVNRAWRATLAMRDMLNPLRFGWFAIALISHKLLRWLVPGFLITALIANLALLGVSPFYWLTLTGQGVFYSAALVAWRNHGHGDLPTALYVPYYFCLVNVASFWGIWQAFQGVTFTTWNSGRGH